MIDGIYILFIVVALSLYSLAVWLLLLRKPKPQSVEWDIRYRSDVAEDTRNSPMEFDLYRMAMATCNGKPVNFENGDTCVAPDGTELCEPTTERPLIFRDTPDGNLELQSDNLYVCRKKAQKQTTCFDNTLQTWKKFHDNAQNLTACPNATDLENYPPHGSCYFSAVRENEAIEKARKFISINDKSCNSDS